MYCSSDKVLTALKCERLKGSLPSGFELAVSTDSRNIKQGMLFFALEGENFDGHNYVNTALEKGALGAVVSRNLDEFQPLVEGQGVVQVSNVMAAMQSLAREYLQWHRAVPTAVTGSVGKTTTKELTAHFLGCRYKTLKTIANFNNDVGLPLTVFGLKSDHERAVFELAMRGPGEIARLARIIQPEYAIITNVAPVHLETLGSLEAITWAKCEVLQFLVPGGAGIVNGDQEQLVTTAKKIRPDVMTFGHSESCNARLAEISCTSNSMKIKLIINGQILRLEHAIPAPALAPDFAAAALCAYLQGISPEELEISSRNFVGADKRLNITSFSEGGAVINDSYNASPLSMNAALATLMIKAGGQRTVAVLGDMFELGYLENAAHQDLGREAHRCGVDLLICIGKRSELTAQSALDSGMDASRVRHFPDLDSARDFLEENVDRSDFILFKASRAMQLDRLAAHFTAAGGLQRGGQ